MDKQEIFDTAYNGVMNQNGVAIGGVIEGGTKYARACFYRRKTENGDILKCGVGHLLTDAELLVCRNSVNVEKDSTASLYALIQSNLFGISSVSRSYLPKHLREHVDFLSQIQTVHDYAVAQAAETFPEVTAHPEFVELFKACFKIDMKIIAEQHNLKFNHQPQPK